jgi:amidase
MTQWWQHGAGQLASAIRAGDTTSVEVVQSHLDRIADVNPRLNAVVEVLAEQALSAAATADSELASRGAAAVGPLHGVPVTIKCNVDLAGSATTHGTAALAGLIAESDSPAVARLKTAGAIPIGRTNCPDMALRVHTDSSLYGLTRNPWHHDRTVGGSSGGEGSALASGMSPLGLGNDIGGSLRNPAHCCGIASIKPTAGVVPSYTGIPSPDGPLSFQIMPVDGPMARTVADVRLGLSVMAGADRRDPWSVPADLSVCHVHDRPLRVAVMVDLPGAPTDPGVATVVRRAADALASAGHTVADAEPPSMGDVLELWGALLFSDLKLIRGLIEPLLMKDGQVLAAILDQVPEPTAASMTQSLMQRQSLLRAWSMWFADFDVLLTPTWTQPAFLHGADVTGDPTFTTDVIRPVMPANALGLPSACVPAGTMAVDGGEVPVAVLLTGNRFADLTTLDAAEAVEAACGLATPIDPRWS